MKLNELNDASAVIRLVWSPKCFDDGVPTTSCFSVDDLLPKKDQSGHDRFVSADCEAEISKESVDARIAHQTRGDFKVRFGRADALFIRFVCGHLRALPDQEPAILAPILVERAPLASNAAHCAIRNISGKSRSANKRQNEAYVEYLRTEMLMRIDKILNYEELFKNQAT